MTTQEPLRVLFVCTANISRSPFLELTAREMVSSDAGVEFASAGTHGFDAHAMDEGMVPHVGEGLPAGHASRRLDREILEGADLVLTAEATHRAFILDEFPQHFRKIFTVGQFAASVADHPDLTGRELITAAAGRRPPALPEHDIADPYRRGEAASRAAADTMTRMLSVIVPRLGAGGPDV